MDAADVAADLEHRGRDPAGVGQLVELDLQPVGVGKAAPDDAGVTGVPPTPAVLTAYAMAMSAMMAMPIQ